MGQDTGRDVTRYGAAWLGRFLEPGLGLAFRVPGGWFLSTGPGQVQPEGAMWAQLLVGSPPAEGAVGVGCNVAWTAVLDFKPESTNTLLTAFHCMYESGTLCAGVAARPKTSPQQTNPSEVTQKHSYVPHLVLTHATQRTHVFCICLASDPEDSDLPQRT